MREVFVLRLADRDDRASGRARARRVHACDSRLASDSSPAARRSEWPTMTKLHAEFVEHHGRRDLARERAPCGNSLPSFCAPSAIGDSVELFMCGGERGERRCNDDLDADAVTARVRSSRSRAFASPCAVLCIFQLPAIERPSPAVAHAEALCAAARSSAAMPGNAFPSRNSSVAPPPVDTCVIAVSEAELVPPPPPRRRRRRRSWRRSAVASAIASPIVRVPFWYARFFVDAHRAVEHDRLRIARKTSAYAHARSPVRYRGSSGRRCRRARPVVALWSSPNAVETTASDRQDAARTFFASSRFR